MFTYWFLSDKIHSFTQKSHLTLGNLDKISVLVNFIIKNWKVQLSLSQFSLGTFFLREREKIFYTYSGPKGIHMQMNFLFWHLQIRIKYPDLLNRSNYLPRLITDIVSQTYLLKFSSLFIAIVSNHFARCSQKWKLMVVLYLDTKQILISRVGCVRVDSWINLVGSPAMQQAQTFRDKKLSIRRVLLWKYCNLGPEYV